MTQIALKSPEQELRDDLRQRAMTLMLIAELAFGTLIILAAEAFRAALSASLLGFAFIMVALAAWSLLGYRPRLAARLTVISFALIAALVASNIDRHLGVLLLTLPGMVALVMLGTAEGMITTLLCSVLALLLVLPNRDINPLYSVVAVFAIWLQTGLAWTATHSAGEALEWWSQTYEQMRSLLEEARTQRVSLKEVQEDLVKSNQELARVSERLRAMREVAEDARRTKEQFVANVSHELRTPLNMIIGFSEMIAHAPHVYGVELPARLLADLEIILSSSKHLASLVDDVLDLSQVDSGHMALSKEWCDVGEIAHAAVLAVVPLFEHKRLTLQVDVAPDLPPVYCDPVRIRQVILNLLSNAGRFTERGTASLKIEMEQRQLHVVVRDTGPGISPESQERIFEPFSQADGSIRRRYGGSGLGLAISKRFVELHNGSMWLESEVGTGTAFHFALPVETASPLTAIGARRWISPEGEYIERVRPFLAPRPEITPRYVVMEPGDTLCHLLSRYQEDADIVPVHTLEQAAQELARLPAHALLINDRRYENTAMPVDQLMSLSYGTPVIACWVPGGPEAAERLGLVHYLLKPVSRSDVLGSLANLPREVRTVLVVDDEPEALQLYARILASADKGYRVLRAPTGRRALQLLRTRHPDAMLLDLVMPGMDGYTLLRAKSRDPEIADIPAIAISAQDPQGGPIASSSLTISRSGGLHVHDLLSTIQVVTQMLAPPDRIDREP